MLRNLFDKVKTKQPLKNMMYKNFLQVIKKLVKKKIKKNIIFDVGANRGQSINFFKKIYPTSIIHAFEPVKVEYQKLTHNYKSKSIFLNNCGVGDSNKLLEFFTTKGTAHSSFLKVTPNTPWLKKRARYWNTINRKFTISSKKVKMVTLDKYCLVKKIKFIDILKIDVEGFEDRVLRGAKTLLNNNRIKLIIIEIKMDNTHGKPNSFYDIEKYLAKNNFRLYALEVLGNGFISRLNDNFGCDAIYFNENLKS